MKLYTRAEAALRLDIPITKLACWFESSFNVLEEVSGVTLEKKDRIWLIPENVLEAYEEFTHSHIINSEAAKLLGLTTSIIQKRAAKGEYLTSRKIGRSYYIHKDEIASIKPLKETNGYIRITEAIHELNVHRCTVIDAINKNKLDGFLQQNIWYVCRKSVIEYKEKYLGIENIQDYYSIGEASEVLGISDNRLRLMIRSDKVDITAKKYKLKNTYYLLKEDVLKLKQFYDDIPKNFYTVKQAADQYNLKISYVSTAFNKLEGVKWVILVRQWEKIVPKDIFDIFFATTDTYRVKSIKDPIQIFKNVIDTSEVPHYLTQTTDLFQEFVDIKQNTSRANNNVQRMFAREYGFLFNLLITLSKELHLHSDNEIKWLLQTTDNSNLKKNLINFLNYIQERCSTSFVEQYNQSTIKRKNHTDNNIYTLKEFIDLENYVKNIELHIDKAVENRKYAVLWLYVSLHLTNAWRSSDFLSLPSIRIDMIEGNNFNWFSSGNRLNSQHALHIVNQFASKRLRISKTGALNRFLVNNDMLLPIATMIILCEIHRIAENDSLLLCSSTDFFRGMFPVFFSEFPFKFSSMKMNRSFITYLFHKANESSEHVALSLDFAQQTRRHKRKDSTAVYVQATNQDGPIGNLTENLCNRGHFGYLYNLLINRLQSFSNNKNIESIEDHTLRIQEFRDKFIPHDLEVVGEFLKMIFEEHESLAVRIALMPEEEVRHVISKIYQDKMPGHTEHAQCFTYPNCINTTALTCIGCPNMIPKNHLLISVSTELQNRVAALLNTKKINVAKREMSWIQKLLFVLQEASNTIGKAYVQGFIEFEKVLDDVSIAFEHFNQLNSEYI